MATLNPVAAELQRQRYPSVHRWSARQILRYAVRWFFLYEFGFTALLILGHQFFVHYWNPRIGFLDSWSVSVIVLVGDTLLSVALSACRVQSALADQRFGKGCMPAQAHTWRWRLTVVLSALLFGYIWQIVLPGPRISATQHHYAWVYDTYHVWWTAYVVCRTVQMTVRSWWLWRSGQLQGALLACALVAAAMWAPYAGIRTYNPPRYEYHTGYQIDLGSWGDRFSTSLFKYGKEVAGESS